MVYSEAGAIIPEYDLVTKLPWPFRAPSVVWHSRPTESRAYCLAAAGPALLPWGTQGFSPIPSCFCLADFTVSFETQPKCCLLLRKEPSGVLPTMFYHGGFRCLFTHTPPYWTERFSSRGMVSLMPGKSEEFHESRLHKHKFAAYTFLL